MRRTGRRAPAAVPADLRDLYLQMCRIREVETAAKALWERGLVSGELHLGLGEEGVVAGVVAQLREGDALALDYRSTPPLVARGLPLEPLLLELVGADDGLCQGRAGHMHLMSRDHLAAASGIVGAPGPLACGFGFAARRRGHGDVAVAFVGDGAVNEGMLMESLNLAAVWRLPVVFVCKDNGWAVTSRPAGLTGGGLRRRAQGLGLPVRRVDGRDAVAVRRVAGAAVRRARAGRGPTFVIARCRRPEGHFMGDPLTRLTRAAGELTTEVRPLLASVTAGPGAPLPSRVRALLTVTGTLARAAAHGRSRRADPVHRLRRRLPEAVATEAERHARSDVDAAVAAVLASAAAADHA